MGNLPRGECGNKEYSRIKHLAKIVAPSRFDWKELYFGMFTACFDASGTVHDKNTPHMIMAGYLARTDQWISFEKQWLARLKIDNIAYFRRSECASNTGQFAGWDKKPKAKKNKLLRDLIGIINHTTICKTGCIVENRILKATLSQEIETQFHLHAYAFTGIVSVSELYKWRDREQIDAPIECVPSVSLS